MVRRSTGGDLDDCGLNSRRGCDGIAGFGLDLVFGGAEGERGLDMGFQLYNLLAEGFDLVGDAMDIATEDIGGVVANMPRGSGGAEENFEGFVFVLRRASLVGVGIDEAFIGFADFGVVVFELRLLAEVAEISPRLFTRALAPAVPLKPPVSKVGRAVR